MEGVTQRMGKHQGRYERIHQGREDAMTRRQYEYKQWLLRATRRGMLLEALYGGYFLKRVKGKVWIVDQSWGTLEGTMVSMDEAKDLPGVGIVEGLYGED